MRQDVTPLRFSNRGLVAHTAVQFLDQSIQGLCYICGRGSCGTVWVKILNKIKKLPPQHAGCCVFFAPSKCLSELSYTFFRFRCPGCCLLLVSLKLLSQLSDTGFRFGGPAFYLREPGLQLRASPRCGCARCLVSFFALYHRLVRLLQLPVGEPQSNGVVL